MKQKKYFLPFAVAAALCLETATAAPAAVIIPAPPQVAAAAHLVLDVQSGAYLVEKNIDQRVEPASLTKMMTAYVVADYLAQGHIAMTDQALVSEKAWRMGGSRMFIEAGKKVAVEDLLKGVIIQSGNDASVALAEHVSHTEEDFARLMNRYAEKLGLQNTHFVNSSGWPHPDHYTTPRDLATLALRLVQDYPDVYALHAVREFTYNDIRQPNRNDLLWRDESVDGVKTGHTENAGFCLVASAERAGRRLISVVLGAADNSGRIRATQSLLNFVFRFYDTRQLYAAGEVITSARVWKGERTELALVVENDFLLTLPKGQHAQLRPAPRLEAPLTAPIAAGQQLGRLELMLEDEVVAALPLTAREAVAAGGFFTRMKDHVLLYWRDQE